MTKHYLTAIGLALTCASIVSGSEVDQLQPSRSIFTNKEQTAHVCYSKEDISFGSVKRVSVSTSALMEKEEANTIYYGIDASFGGVWSTYALDYIPDTTVTIKHFGLGATIGLRGGYSWELFSKLALTPYLKLSTGFFAPESQFISSFVNGYNSAIGLRASYAFLSSLTAGLDVSISRPLGRYSRITYLKKGWTGTGKEKFGYSAALPITYKPAKWDHIKFFVEPKYAGSHLAHKGSFEYGIGTIYCF